MRVTTTILPSYDIFLRFPHWKKDLVGFQILLLGPAYQNKDIFI